MPDLQALLDQIDQLDQQATQAPWTATGDVYGGKVYEPSGYPLPGCTSCGENEATYEGRDAEFIALARTALPQLAKTLRATLELHKPSELYPAVTPGVIYCVSCWNGVTDEAYEYPCPTAQTITDLMEGDQ